MRRPLFYFFGKQISILVCMYYFQNYFRHFVVDVIYSIHKLSLSLSLSFFLSFLQMVKTA